MVNRSASPAGDKPAPKKGQSLLPEDVEQIALSSMSPVEKLARFFKSRTPKLGNRSPFYTPAITVDVVNEQLEIGRFDRAIKNTTRLALLIAVFCCILAVGAPFFAPLYIYHAITPEGRASMLVPLELPNLTNPAIVSWAATSVTEVLSFGFGDVEAKTVLQKKRFTKTGWEAFVKAFLSGNIGEQFKKSQMVITTVPTDTPVIISQGVNDENAFEWKVEVPIISTYAANNNVIKPQRGSVQMTIVRVPYEINSTGIAIDVWKQMKH